MTDHTPSGQQAVEPWQIVRASMVEQAGDDNPSRVARNILHALRNAGFTVSRTAAPTAPSTAAGEKTSAVKQMERSPERWANMSPDVVADGSRAQVAYALKDAQHDIALLVAALARATTQEQGR